MAGAGYAVANKSYNSWLHELTVQWTRWTLNTYKCVTKTKIPSRKKMGKKNRKDII